MILCNLSFNVCHPEVFNTYIYNDVPNTTRICILDGPEDDSIRIETCCPNTIRTRILQGPEDDSIRIETCCPNTIIVRICILDGPEDDSIRIETCCPNAIIIIRISILEEPEDGSIRIETCCPNTIINTIKFRCVWLIHHCKFIYVQFRTTKCIIIHQVCGVVPPRRRSTDETWSSGLTTCIRVCMCKLLVL